MPGLWRGASPSRRCGRRALARHGLIATDLAKKLAGGRPIALTGTVQSGAVLSGEVSVSTLGAAVKVPAGGAVAGGISPTEHVEPGAAEFTATDYGALAFLIAVFCAVLSATENVETSGGAVALAWLLLTCPQTRAAILRLTRSMYGG